MQQSTKNTNRPTAHCWVWNVLYKLRLYLFSITMHGNFLDVGLIVGLTITGVLILIAVILGVWYYRRRKRSRKPKSIPRYVKV